MSKQPPPEPPRVESVGAFPFAKLIRLLETMKAEEEARTRAGEQAEATEE